MSLIVLRAQSSLRTLLIESVAQQTAGCCCCVCGSAVLSDSSNAVDFTSCSGRGLRPLLPLLLAGQNSLALPVPGDCWLSRECCCQRAELVEVAAVLWELLLPRPSGQLVLASACCTCERKHTPQHALTGRNHTCSAHQHTSLTRPCASIKPPSSAEAPGSTSNNVCARHRTACLPACTRPLHPWDCGKPHSSCHPPAQLRGQHLPQLHAASQHCGALQHVQQ
jgi:hypothetical protein